MPYFRCSECQEEYWRNASYDGGLCPDCDQAEQDAYHRAYAADWPELPSRRRIMQERLGTHTDRDE